VLNVLNVEPESWYIVFVTVLNDTSIIGILFPMPQYDVEQPHLSLPEEKEANIVRDNERQKKQAGEVRSLQTKIYESGHQSVLCHLQNSLETLILCS